MTDRRRYWFRQTLRTLPYPRHDHRGRSIRLQRARAEPRFFSQVDRCQELVPKFLSDPISQERCGLDSNRVRR